MRLLLPGMIAGLITGMMMTVQGSINSALANRIGTYGSVFIVTIVNLALIGLIVLIFPQSMSLQNLPGWNRWYLYLGGVLGIFILASTIIILPRFGATSGFICIISGQLIGALILDHFGLLGMEKVSINLTKIAGVLLFILGAYLVTYQR